MDEQTQLKDSILAQAHEKGRKLLEEAKETILKEETAQEERLIQDKLNQRSEQLKRIQRQLQRETQQIENKKRQSTLVTKQRVLKDLFADAYEAMVAWPLEKEMQFVDTVLDRYQGQVVTLTFGAVSAAKFDSAALERLKQALSCQLGRLMTTISTVIWWIPFGSKKATRLQPAFSQMKRTRRLQ